jgi:hypothetical protein
VQAANAADESCWLSGYHSETGKGKRKTEKSYALLILK